jgi:YebC/PmpR family DNA-binding regulatory protein
MAGHSKWANIQYRKKAKDSQKEKIFTKLIRNITVAVQKGGAEPEANASLRTAILKALSQNMTRETIDRAIKRGVGDDRENMDEIRYEGYGPGGVALLIDCLTDNRNRTVAQIRHALSRCGGSLGGEGSVAYLFHKKGVITFPPHADENKLMAVALEAGAEDMTIHQDGSVDIFTSPDCYENVDRALKAAGLQPESSDILMLAENEVSLSKENVEKLLKLIDMIEDLDDVQNVYANANISDEI